ncbi:MAG: cytochrome c [Flavobacteriales bacterium]|jgi:mono/diheme cytochrome c family protein|nr:cytochrome c [Flavobacteriales bacterium]MBT6808876.1 cytochrome c [Flavobacteriales bacterium]
MNKLFVKIGLFAAVISLAACTGGDSSPGYEYMPNMYRSPGIETYGEHNIDGYKGIPVEGTISRGNLSTFNYDKSDKGYELAGIEAHYPSNFNKNNEILNQGKELYGIMCAHCHGSNGDGKGTIQHAVYSSVPSYNDTIPNRRNGSSMSELKEGHIFHAITYGLRAMGPHASQISEEERWKIVYYIQEKLQK